MQVYTTQGSFLDSLSLYRGGHMISERGGGVRLTVKY